MAAPTVSAITPATLVAGAAPVAMAITGTNFAAGAVVSAPGLTIQAVVVASATSITAKVSAFGSTRGATTVTVTNLDAGTVNHAGPVVKTADVNAGALDYGYANPLPATNVGSNATGVQSLGSVVESGVVAPGAHPFVGGLGTPTEAGHFDLNPAYATAVDTQGVGAGLGVDTPAQQGGLAPGDAAGDVPGNVNPPTEAAPTDHSAQIPNKPAVTSATPGAAGHATVNWTHAADADGYALSGYTVTATSSDGGTSPVTKVVAGNVLTADVSGLTSAKHYTFTVHATNQAGSSAESAASASILIA